ncbi:XRE family transcriptional regulator [Neglecta sp. X4]|uniref:helix-turn-helix domain-containing protein n=1 Tax=unclassified Neglectibacter TaxID=2632164 RepID=UPI0013697CDA|nr:MULTISPECIES: helix-turn-helix transcriptional regulator [unclassified Neglectibacter]NBI19176.1 XRE family transcriptional regulator [Neglectibacter sp. 59]NBJ74864.1 XRE family transcriptional regulator [Neglectibacter sp. X4]NCE82682.1 XRE family transcriptional regulator [Neglectibacter sp. X58]
MPVGDRIRAIRTERGLTQKELGELCGMADSAIRRYESNRGNPTQKTLLKIAKALDVHLRDLSDSSWLEEIDRQYPTAGEEYARYKAVNKYLEEMGFTISERPIKLRDEEVDDEGHTAKIPDEWEIILSKDGHTATFTDAEFEELQAGAKEAIEGKFYKKVLEQQKK